MDIQQLKYAVEVARCRSFSEAAERLCVNQTLLSNIIRELEADMGMTIFSGAQGVVVTTKGEEFLSHARAILDRLDEVERLYKGEGKEDFSYKVTAPISCYIAQAFMAFVQEVLDKARVKIDYFETNSIPAMHRVAEHGSNIGIIRYQESNEDYYLHSLERMDLLAVPLWSFQYRLLFSRESPLARKDRIEQTDLEGLTEISHGETSVHTHPISRLIEMKHKGIRPQEIVVYDRQSQLELLCQIPQTYLWAAPTPRSVLERYPLIQKECGFVDYSCKDVLIFRKGYSLSSADQLFLQKIREEIAVLESGADA